MEQNIQKQLLFELIDELSTFEAIVFLSSRVHARFAHLAVNEVLEIVLATDFDDPRMGPDVRSHLVAQITVSLV